MKNIEMMLPQWGIMFDEHPHPCFITEINSVDIVYTNQLFQELYPEFENMIGQNFYEVVPHSQVEIDQVLPDWSKERVFVSKVFNKLLNCIFLMKATLLEHGEYVFCQLLPEQAQLQEHLKFEDAMTRCMEIYNDDQDTKYALMELLARFYHCESACIYRINYEDNTLHCVSLWTELEKKSTLEASAELDSKRLLAWMTETSVGGVLMFNGEDPEFDHNSLVGKGLAQYGIKNVIVCHVEDAHHNIVGMLCIDNLKQYQEYFDRRLLTTVARFVAQDVCKGAVDATLFQMHHQDSLTGLYNRARYARRLEHFLTDPSRTMGVISVNINGLKEVNDNAGINAGDELIKVSAHLLRDHFGFEIYRMSGDEFIGLAPDISQEDFEEKVESLHKTMKSEENNDFSLGHAWGKGNIDIPKLVVEAETIMYINKQKYYSSSRREFSTVKDSILADLLGYLANGEFMIYLQAQVRLEEGSLHGAEALIRRFDKTNQKMVFPDQFISFYEQKSLIRHIDIFVVEEVCQLLVKWKAEGKQQLPISVNLSRVTLQEYGIVDTIAKICDRYDVDRKYLVIEVTERVGLIENNVESSLVMDFKDRGFRISLDDFGCAYSNIVTLAQIEVDEVKLDKSLVDYVTTNEKNQILVRNVLRMCNELKNTATLAEGIENKEQADLLYSLGCHLGQGYYYSRPIPVDEFCEKYTNG